MCYPCLFVLSSSACETLHQTGPLEPLVKLVEIKMLLSNCFNLRQFLAVLALAGTICRTDRWADKPTNKPTAAGDRP